MFSLTQNINYKPPIQTQYISRLVSSAPKKTSLLGGAFGGAMIDRIHNIRPGCGSCGK
jgi:hypothetical protein